MHQSLIVDILEGIGGLRDVGNNLCKLQPRAAWIARAQRSVGRVLHHKIGNAVLNREIEHADDMGMSYINQALRLDQKFFQPSLFQGCAQELDRRLSLDIKMFAQVDLGEPSLPQQTHQPIIAKLLPATINHETFSCKALARWLYC